jgi:cytidine deaminase
MADEKLIEIAKKVSDNAYAPYSQFKVGAALLCKSGKVFTGCNVENSSYGLTNCAERTAVFKAVSEGESEFVKMVIYTDSEILFTPCGACRQVLSEFNDSIKILIVSNSEQKETDLKELLPMNFSLRKD